MKKREQRYIIKKDTKEKAVQSRKYIKKNYKKKINTRKKNSQMSRSPVTT